MNAMTSFKRLGKKETYRINSDRDSGYEDLSPTSRADGSLEDIKKNQMSSSSTEWISSTRIQSPVYEYKESETYGKKKSNIIFDEHRKREVDAGKIGISHMLREKNIKIRDKELPNLKPALKSTSLVLEGKEYAVPSRRPRGKRRSKSADGKSVRQISMFNPIYTKILSPQEMEERRKWTEKLRMDAILDEEYYKLPYEDINKEIALGRYSRSEPRLNWRRKQRKKVSFSVDIEQTEENLNEEKIIDSDWNWKEDSGFHEIDITHLKPIVKNSSITDNSFDDSNVFPDDEDSSSDDASSDDSCAESGSIELGLTEESEFQSLHHLVKEQEKQLSVITEVPEGALVPEIQTKYINELIMQLKVAPSNSKSKIRKPICADFKTKVSGYSVIDTEPVKPKDMKHVSNSETQSTQQINITLNENINANANINSMPINYNNILENEVPVISQNTPEPPLNVTAIVHKSEDTGKLSVNFKLDNQMAMANLDHLQTPNDEKDLILQNQDCLINKETYIMQNNILQGKDETKRDITLDKERLPNEVFEIKLEPERVIEISPQPVKTFPSVEWHRDFIDYNRQSPINHYGEDSQKHQKILDTFIKPVRGSVIPQTGPSNSKKGFTKFELRKPPQNSPKVDKIITVDKPVTITSVKPKLLKINNVIKSNKTPSIPVESAKRSSLQEQYQLSSSLTNANIITVEKPLTSPSSLSKSFNITNISEITKPSSVMSKTSKITNLDKQNKPSSIMSKTSKITNLDKQNEPSSIMPKASKITNLDKPNKPSSNRIEAPKVTNLDEPIIMSSSSRQSPNIKNFYEQNKSTSTAIMKQNVDKVDELKKSHPIPPKSLPIINVNSPLKLSSTLQNSDKVDKFNNIASNNRAPKSPTKIKVLTQILSPDIISQVNQTQSKIIDTHSSSTASGRSKSEDKPSNTLSSPPVSPKIRNLHGLFETNTSPPKSPKTMIKKEISVFKGTEDNTIPVNNTPKPESDLFHKQKFIDIIGKDKFNFFYPLSNKDGKTAENNNNVVVKEIPIIEESASDVPNNSICHGVNYLKQNTPIDSMNEIKNYENIKPNNTESNHKASDTQTTEKYALDNNINLDSNYRPDGESIIKNKLILEEDFFCETDNSDERMLSDTSESTESEDLIESSPESNASYNIEHETHEVSIKDSPKQSKCSVNEHHEYFKEEGQSMTTNDKESSAVKSVVRKKVEETVTEVINTTSVVTPDRKLSSKRENESEDMQRSASISDNSSIIQPKAAERSLDQFSLYGSHLSPTTFNKTPRQIAKTYEKQSSPSTVKSPPLALPRKSILNGESNKKEPKASKKTNLINKTRENNRTIHENNSESKDIQQDNKNKTDNMIKIKEAFIKAGLNPKVFDDLDNFDTKSSVLPSDFRQNFVNMFLTKEFNFTDYNIHLKTRTNSSTPNCTVTRKFLPMSIINEQMSWMRETPAGTPIYTCQIASSNENIHKAALNLNKRSTSGTDSPEECYEYNERDESPIADKTTSSPTPSWTESSSSGCFSASCSPTPHVTTGKTVPMPTSL